ncbi:Uncharacterized protein APZ42_024832 [Daphnia magna]|uniref:Uncharacterized protein n=1 Tax=Daphnia magna TaxID=35525 RepID=A0A164TPX5_9CRUS|nr:Uncharacterized protein APZ42_024832 [Daphnia magna]
MEDIKHTHTRDVEPRNPNLYTDPHQEVGLCFCCSISVCDVDDTGTDCIRLIQ